MVEQAAAVVQLKDAAIVAGAMHAQATFLVTYDRRHLLSHADLIEQVLGVKVMTPQVILDALA